MKLAFYKAFQSRQNNESVVKYVKRLWLDWLIAVASFGKYSHVELIDGDDWFSISPRTGRAQKRQITPDADKWDFVDLKLLDRDIERIKELIPKYVDYRYDYIGALTSITPICLQNPDKIFCSEVATNILNQTYAYGYLRDGCKYSPSKLYEEIK